MILLRNTLARVKVVCWRLRQGNFLASTKDSGFTQWGSVKAFASLTDPGMYTFDVFCCLQTLLYSAGKPCKSTSYISLFLEASAHSSFGV